VSLKLDYLPAEESFLDPVRADAGDPASARAVVIPFGLEASVSYGGGTGSGPAAILAASHQLELYDDELECEPYLRYGVAAVREPVISRPVEAALTQLQSLVEAVLDAGKFPLVLGGRHKDLAVLQLDAHADLRDGYQGERFSHAAAMRRVLDSLNVSLVSVGIRAISREEVEFYQANRDRITIHWAKDRARWNLDAMLAPLKGRPVYLTFDIDALDASVMPATGTPTPGGLSYGAALEIVRRACGAGNVVGADLVELAPIEGLHACDYTAAAIAYKMLSYTLA
jgi:agmatinase